MNKENLKTDEILDFLESVKINPKYFNCVFSFNGMTLLRSDEYDNRLKYTIKLQQENKQLKDNWNNLKKDIGYELLKLREPNEYNNGLCNAFNYINNKMQELERRY